MCYAKMLADKIEQHRLLSTPAGSALFLLSGKRLRSIPAPSIAIRRARQASSTRTTSTNLQAQEFPNVPDELQLPRRRGPLAPRASPLKWSLAELFRKNFQA